MNFVRKLPDQTGDGWLLLLKVDAEVVGLRGDGCGLRNHNWWHLLHMLILLV